MRFIYLLLLIFFATNLGFSQTYSSTKKNKYNLEVDIQGHRGYRGLYPENTIEACLAALRLGIKTLEIDICISKDNQVILSHEPWLNSEFCADKDGNRILKEYELQYNLYQMTYEEIKQFDCGSVIHPRFREQLKIKTSKPSLSDLVVKVREFCSRENIPLPHFNIEIKREPKFDGIFCPPVKEFIKIVVKTLDDLQIKNHCNIQSFDFDILREMHKTHKEIPLAFLIEHSESIDYEIATLGFTPQIYSCHYSIVDNKLMQSARKHKMKIIPWTVNDKDEIRRLLKLKVDGIISDYPERVQEVIQMLKK